MDAKNFLATYAEQLTQVLAIKGMPRDVRAATKIAAEICEEAESVEAVKAGFSEAIAAAKGRKDPATHFLAVESVSFRTAARRAGFSI